MNAFEAAVTAALTILTALAAFALTVAVLTLGGVALLLFACGVLLGWTIPRPRP